MKLDANELGVLVEALEAWINKEQSTEFMGDVLIALLPENPEAKMKHEERKQKQLQDKQLRKERAIIIQAKLLGMRDSLLVDGFVGERSS